MSAEASESLPPGGLSKMQKVQDSLIEMTSFLYDYLTLANAHMVDFFTADLWHTFLPLKIGEELLAIPDEELPFLATRWLDGKVAKESDTGNRAPSEHSELCRYSGNKREVSLKCAKYLDDWSPHYKRKFNRKIPPTWQHANLLDFIAASQRNTLDKLNVLTTLNELKELETCALNDVVHIGHFMDEKKNHEIDIMANVCQALAGYHKISKVVDIGSGRGYLSAQLSLLYHLKVVGVDASNVNTHSALNRNSKLEKHWNGLLRNAKQKNGNSRKKSGKNYTESADNNGAKPSMDIIENKGKADCADTSTRCSVLPNNTQESDSFTSNISSTAIPDNAYSSDGQQTVSAMASDTSCTCSHEAGSERVDSEVGTSQPKSQTKACSYVPVTMYVDINTKLHDIIADRFSETVTEVSGDCGVEHENCLMLTGLHTCGDLASNLMRIFMHDASARILCNVGCCYHLIEEKFVRNAFLKDGEADIEGEGFPLSQFLTDRGWLLGRNARMLAAQALDRIADGKKQPSKAMLYRAILQVILRDLLHEERWDWSVGKIAAKCASFHEYVRKSLKKLKVDDSQLTDEDITAYLNRFSDYERNIRVFFQLRTMLAPCIESIILLDRLCFLLEQGVKDAHLVKLFDPVISPRCYAIIACK